ncbi:MAG: SMP-30/gluconolactonase/LRE family protein, partial [Acidimicrobiales bacterium]
MPSIDRVSTGPAELGECPVWSTTEQVLYWADIEGRQIHRFDPVTDETGTRHLPGRPGSFVLTPDPGRLLVGMENELVVFDWENGESFSWLKLDTGAEGNRLNDGRCDAAGRYIVGSIATDYRSGGTTGVLHQVEPSGS